MSSGNKWVKVCSVCSVKNVNGEYMCWEVRLDSQWCPPGRNKTTTSYCLSLSVGSTYYSKVGGQVNQ